MSDFFDLLGHAIGSSACGPYAAIGPLVSPEAADVEKQTCTRQQLDGAADHGWDIAARMDQADAVPQGQPQRNRRALSEVEQRRRNCRGLVIGQRVPDDPCAIEPVPDRRNLVRVFPVCGFFKADEVDRIALRQPFEIGNDLALAERLQHPVIADIKNRWAARHGLR